MSYSNKYYLSSKHNYNALATSNASYGNFYSQNKENSDKNLNLNKKDDNKYNSNIYSTSRNIDIKSGSNSFKSNERDFNPSKFTDNFDSKYIDDIYKDSNSKDKNDFKYKNYNEFYENKNSNSKKDYYFLEPLIEEKGFFNSKKETKQDTKIYPWNTLVGINNEGVSCYINSSLQCILHLKEFITNYYDFYEKNESKLNKSLIILFNELIEKMIYSAAQYINSFSIEAFYQYYTKINSKQFEFHTQQDALEFTRNFLDSMSKLLNVSHFTQEKPKYLKFTNDEKYKSLKEKLIYYEAFVKQFECPMIIDVFYCFSLTKFTCGNCLKETTSPEYFLDIPLYFRKFFI